MSYGNPPGYGGYGQQPPGGYGQQPPGGGGYGGGGGSYGTPPPNHLVWAIISIFLCWPLAIPAIIFANQVNQKFQMGDFAGAQDSSSKAKTYSLIATILGGIWVVFWVIWVLFFVILAAKATHDLNQYTYSPCPT